MDKKTNKKFSKLGVCRLKIMQDIEKLVFIVVGNFITSSFLKDFTLFELLRMPLKFPISKDGKFFIAKIPKGLPWQESVFFLGETFVTKVKDIPVRKGLQKADDKNDYFVIDAESLEKLMFNVDQLDIGGGHLTYSPFYRFVTEPFIFDMEKNVSEYVSNALGYILRSGGISNLVKNEKDGCSDVLVIDSKLPLERIAVVGKDRLDKLELYGGKALSELDLVNKKILLSRLHCPVCFDALVKTGDADLKNIRLEKNKERIEVLYEQ